jgi:NitT/TauT family transport system substrate-binding protein
MIRLLAATFLLLAAATPAMAADLATVKVGWGLTVATAPAMIATDKGYFRQLGLQPENDEFKGSADAFSALATGQLDIDLGGVTAGFFNAAASGLDARIVAPLSIQGPAPGTTPLMARKDLWDAGTIRSAADLRGRKVAVNAPGNGVEYKLSLILASAGMGFKDIDLTRIGFPEMLVAFKTHAIDAAVPAEPFSQLAEEQKLAVVMMKESEAGHGDVTTMVLMSGKFLRERRPLAVRYLQGIAAGIRDLAGNGWKSDRNIAIMTHYMRLDPKVMRDSPFPEFDPKLDIADRFASLRRQETVHRKNGYLQYAKPLAESDVIDPTIARDAVAAMGK